MHLNRYEGQRHTQSIINTHPTPPHPRLATLTAEHLLRPDLQTRQEGLAEALPRRRGHLQRWKGRKWERKELKIDATYLTAAIINLSQVHWHSVVQIPRPQSPVSCSMTSSSGLILPLTSLRTCRHNISHVVSHNPALCIHPSYFFRLRL